MHRAMAAISEMTQVVGFVCAASPRIGGGHVMRCLTLAGEMKRHGADIRFAVNAEALQSVPYLDQSGFQITTVASFVEPEAWPGVFDVIVFDSYAIDARVERAFRTKTKKIVVIDDLADRPHDCDLLIDSTWGRLNDHHQGLVPPHAQILAGPNYALLRPEFAALRPASLARRTTGEPLDRILVSFGLTDVGRITARVVRRLLGTQVKAQVDVVVGSRAESLAALEELASADHRLKLHVNANDMARLMASADLAIGAGGQTSWERCCLGLPSIIVVLADNQRASALALETAGAAEAVLGVTDADLDAIPAMVSQLSANAAARNRMAANAAKIVDGRGSSRVWDALCPLMPSAVMPGPQTWT
jgi:UDP-2,4-diacetamido-2,4,6-trideoxy-beta-L-altropyranose hydrolase